MKLDELLALLKTLGLDPQLLAGQLAGQVEKAAFAALLAKGVPFAVADAEKHGWTPAKIAGHPDACRQMIRAAMYQVLKHSLPIPFGANLAADAIRDRLDDAVVAAVAPGIDANLTTSAVVARVVAAMAEQAF